MNVIFDISSIKIDNNSLLKINSYFEDISKTNLIILCFSILIINSLLNFVSQVLAYRYVFTEGYKTSKNLFESYLNNDYIFFFKN